MNNFVLFSGDLYPSDPVDCPENQYFDVTLTTPRCDPIANAEPGFCDDLCSPCNVLYSFPDDTTPDPYDCNAYHISLNSGQTVKLTCGGSEYYNYKTGTCETEPNVCFNFCDECFPYCLTTGDLANPSNCFKYYYCELPYLISASCPPGEIYSEIDNTCSTDHICFTTCPSV